jgi:hypothetical protein
MITRFAYHTEPITGALALAAPFLLLGALVDHPLARVVGLATCAGPLAWAGLQSLRRGRGVSLHDDARQIVITRSLSGRTARVGYDDVRGWLATRRGGLALAYEVPPPTAATAASPPAQPGTDPIPLTAMHSAQAAPGDIPAGPRRGLILTAKLDDVATLTEQIAARTEAAIPPEYMRQLAARRRTRDVILAFFIVAGTPLYVAFLVRISWIFQ